MPILLSKLKFFSDAGITFKFTVYVNVILWRIKTERINKVLQGAPHVVDAINDNNISLVFNTTETPQAIKDSKSIRRSSLENGIPYYTTVSGAVAAVAGIKSIKEDEMDVIPIQLYKK